MERLCTIFGRKLVKHCFALLLASFVLAACTNITPSPVCVGSDDLGNDSKNIVTLGATDSSWLDTGISALGGGKFSISVTGNLTTCSNSASCNGTNGQFMKVYVGALTAGQPPSGATITDMSSSGVYAATADVNGGRIYVHLNDSDGDYSDYSTTSIPFNLLQCRVTAFTASAASPYSYCVNTINSFTYSTYSNQATGQISTVGHQMDASIGTQGGIVQCNITSVAADDGSLSTTNPSNAYTCMTTLNAVFASSTPADFSGCTVTAFTSDTASDKSLCVNLLNNFRLANTVTTANGSISGTNPCTVTSATGTSSGSGSTGNCRNDINSATTGSPASASTSANSGAYLVSVSASKEPDTKFVGLLTQIINSVRNILQGHGETHGVTQIMYENVVANSEFILGVKAFIALSIVFLAFRYMVGLSQVSHREVISFVIKMSIVLAMATPGSWWFFSHYLFSLFLQGTDSLSYTMSHNINDLVARGFDNTAVLTASSTTSGSGQGDSVFGFLNFTMSILFSKEANIKLSAIFFTFPLGPVIGITMYIGVFYFLMAVGKALLTYITSIIMVALLLVMAPLCITFLMFQKTKEMFDKWIKLLASFALQPVLLIMLLSIFNVFILLSLYDILNFTACFTCVWNPTLPVFGNICALHGYAPWGIDSSLTVSQKLAKTPVGLLYAIIFVILANIMTKFSQFVDTISSELSAEGTGTSLSSAVSRGAGEMAVMASQIKSSAIGAASYTAKRADYLTGNMASDAAKIAARNVIGGKGWGGVDETGRRLDVSTNFMTSRERAGYEKDLAAFRSLDKDAQQGVIQRNKESRALEGAMDLNARKEVYGATLGERMKNYALAASPIDRLKHLGGTEKGMEFNRKTSALKAQRGPGQLKEFDKLGQGSDNYWSRNMPGGADRLERSMNNKELLDTKYDANKAKDYNQKKGESDGDVASRRSELLSGYNNDVNNKRAEISNQENKTTIDSNKVFERYDKMKESEKESKVDSAENKKALAKEARNTVYSGDKKIQRQDDGSYKISKKNDDGSYS